MKVFRPSHVAEPEPPPLTRGSRGIKSFDGIPTITETILKLNSSSLKDECRPEPTEAEEKEANDRMESIKLAIKRRMAATFGGTFTQNYD